MNYFWLTTIGLSLFAVLIITIPAITFSRKARLQKSGNKHTQLEEQRQAQNIAIFKDRLSEIEYEYSAGNISEDTLEELTSELEQSLLYDVDMQASGATNPGDSASKNEKNLSGAMLASLTFCSLFVVSMSYFTYSELGEYQQVEQQLAMGFDADELDKAREAAQSGDMSGLLSQLHAKLLEAPDNLEGWGLLARSAMSSERFNLSAEAYSHIIRLLEKNERNSAPVYGLLAQAQYYQSQGRLNSTVQATIDRAFALNKDESNSLGLLAIHAYGLNDFDSAIGYWQRILTSAPDHSSKQSILAGIARAQSELGIESETLEIEDTDKRARITVSVGLAASLFEQLKPDDTVFVFAKMDQKLDGALNIPLAASRHRVAELPFTIVLDDSKSMGPMAKLSQTKIASVIARVSISGNPIAQPGDYEVSVDGIEVFLNKSIELEIGDPVILPN